MGNLAGLRKRLRGQVRKCLRLITIEGYAEFATRPSRRALVDYLAFPLLVPSAFRRRVVRSHAKAELIPRALNEMGYIVDVVDWENTSWRPARNYDLLIGHGGVNFGRVAEQMSNATFRVYLATGMYWKEHNNLEEQRFMEMWERSGIELTADRAIVGEEERALRVADGIMCLANRRGVQSYGCFSNVVGLNNVIYPTGDAGRRYQGKEGAHRHFLFFSGRGNVHKGLDVLLEAFANRPHLHIHICQHLDKAFETAYHDMLYLLPNIHYEGFVSTRSRSFDRLCKCCNWVILPSCADFQPRSVLECMAHGLIPVLPETVCIDVGEFGIRMSSCRPNIIEELIEYLSQMSKAEIARRAELSKLEAVRMYSPEYFLKSFKSGVKTLQEKLNPGISDLANRKPCEKVCA